MSNLFIPLIFLVLSGWVLDVTYSYSTYVRIPRQVQGEGMEAGLSKMPKAHFHHGSTDGDMGGHSTGEHHLSGHEHLSGEHHLNGHGHLTDEHNLSGHLGQGHHRGGEMEGNGKGSLSAAGGAGLRAISGAAGMVNPPALSGGHIESPTGLPAGGLGVASGREQELVGQLLDIWSKIDPETLGKIAGMSGGGGALPVSSPHSPPPGAPSFGGTGTMEGLAQSFSAVGVSQGGAGNVTSGGSAVMNSAGAGSKTSQPAEVVYVIMMPEYAETPKGTHPTGSGSASGGRNAAAAQLPLAYGRGGYTAYSSAGTYKMAQGAATPGTVTYTVIPVESWRGRPTPYGGTARTRGSTYTAWPMTYGTAASRQYATGTYTVVPANQVVLTRAQQGVSRPATTYYAVQGGSSRSSATSQQRAATGVTYAAVPAVIMPAQTYKVASG